MPSETCEFVMGIKNKAKVIIRSIIINFDAKIGQFA